MEPCTRTKTEIKTFDTPDEMFESFARVFGRTTVGENSWVSFDVDGVHVVMFAVPAPATSSDQE